MNKIFLVIGIGILIFIIFFMRPSATNTYNEGEIKLAGQTISIEIVETPVERSRGLSGRDGLSDNQGMLFVFDQPQSLNFWMKDMKFAIDMVWINDTTVISITHDAKPQPGASDAELIRYSSNGLADKVLEVSSGWAELHGLKVGDKVDPVYQHR